MKRRSLVRWIGSGMVAGALLTGGIAINSTFAQTPAQTTPSTEQTTPSQDQTQPNQDQTTPPQGDFGGRGRGGRHGGPGGMGRGGMNLVQATATVTGLTTDAVQAEFDAGKTAAQVAEANGKTADDVVNEIVAQAKTKLDADVAAGTITQAQADERLAQIKDHAAQEVTEVHTGGPKGGMGRGGMHLIQATADVTGLTVDQIRTELDAGKTLEQIAQANGKTADDIIANLKTKGEERLQQELDQARTQLSQPLSK